MGTINDNIMNLSDYSLTSDDKHLLNLGLTFIPTHNGMHKTTVYESLARLTRSLELKDFFSNDDNDFDRNDFKKMFMHKSDWTPEIEDITLDTLDTITKLHEVTDKILNKYPKKDEYHYVKNLKHNITREQRQAMKTLRANKDIIIKCADKGGMTCIMNRPAYLKEAYRQLNNNKYYTKIEQSRKQLLCDKINEIMIKLCEDGIISDRQFDYLTANIKDKDRNFYLLPKIHKPRDKWPNVDMPEGRPIVGDCATESRRVSDLLDHYIKPLANKHLSYIKDTNDFVKKIRNKQIHKNCFLVTGDITSLYTNMNINRTIAVLKRALRTNPQPGRPDDEIITLLELIMKNNDFHFNNEIFLQIFGTAMGKTFAPNLANLYLLDFDRQARTGFRIQPSLFYRFLDDIFFIWTGTRQELFEFEQFLNSIIPNIKVNLTISETEVDFLDTTVFKYNQDTDTTLQTKVFFKSTDTHQLLHSTSFHPPHTTSGILKSQVIRFKRLSSFKKDFDNACNTLFRVLCKRGYNRRLLRKTKHDIWFDHNRTTRKDADKPLLPIVIPYSPISVHLVREWKRIIAQSKKFRDYRTIAAYTKHKNLKQILTCSK